MTTKGKKSSFFIKNDVPASQITQLSSKGLRLSNTPAIGVSKDGLVTL